MLVPAAAYGYEGNTWFSAATSLVSVFIQAPPRGTRLPVIRCYTWPSMQTSAIGRVSSLKTLAFFPKGDCWNGGGLFLDNNRYWLNGDGCHQQSRGSTDLQREQTHRPVGGRKSECLSVYYPRLLRDGWRLKDHLSAGLTDGCGMFEKPLADGWLQRT